MLTALEWMLLGMASVVLTIFVAYLGCVVYVYWLGVRDTLTYEARMLKRAEAWRAQADMCCGAIDDEETRESPQTKRTA